MIVRNTGFVRRFRWFRNRAKNHYGSMISEIGRSSIYFSFTAHYEKPRILDGDDRLGGEGLHKRDLFVVERFNPQSVNKERLKSVKLGAIPP